MEDDIQGMGDWNSCPPKLSVGKMDNDFIAPVQVQHLHVYMYMEKRRLNAHVACLN